MRQNRVSFSSIHTVANCHRIVAHETWVSINEEHVFVVRASRAATRTIAPRRRKRRAFGDHVVEADTVSDLKRVALEKGSLLKKGRS